MFGFSSKKSARRRADKRQIRQLSAENLESRQLMTASPGSEAIPAAHWLGHASMDGGASLHGQSGSIIYSPAQMRHAYGVDSFHFTLNGQAYGADGRGQTIAIVIGGHDPNIVRDLQAFDRYYGLPDPNFNLYYANGTRPAMNDASGLIETSMDVEWAHAMAPRANIVLVEAADMSYGALGRAIDVARSIPSVDVVSMSWGSAEQAGGYQFYSQYDTHFTTPAGHKGITFIASSGDNGAWADGQHVGVSYPSSSPRVMAVGGTSLAIVNGGYAGEAAWNGSGGGYSQIFAEPYYQTGVQRTGVRTVPDVAWDADPNTGVGVILTNPSTGRLALIAGGGTSAGAPQMAGLMAVVNEGRMLNRLDSLRNGQATMYALPGSDFHDIQSGGNGYRAHAGYDLATGRGTPMARNVVSHLMVTNAFQSFSTSSSLSGAMPLSHTPTNNNSAALAMLYSTYDVAGATANDLATTHRKDAAVGSHAGYDDYFATL
jgi:subtilase family serine protease